MRAKRKSAVLNASVVAAHVLAASAEALACLLRAVAGFAVREQARLLAVEVNVLFNAVHFSGILMFQGNRISQVVLRNPLRRSGARAYRLPVAGSVDPAEGPDDGALLGRFFVDNGGGRVLGGGGGGLGRRGGDECGAGEGESEECDSVDVHSGRCKDLLKVSGEHESLEIIWATDRCVEREANLSMKMSGVELKKAAGGRRVADPCQNKDHAFGLNC